MSIQLLGHLISSHLHLRSIYYNALISKVKAILTIGRLMLASDEGCNHLCHSSERYFLGIKEVPSLPLIVDRDICRLRLLSWNGSIKISVHEMIGHFHGSVSDVRIELELGDLRLGLKWLETSLGSWDLWLRNRVSLVTFEES